MSKLFIFDMGGVVANHTNVIPSIADFLKITEEQFFQFAGQNWLNLLCGKINSQQFWKYFSKRIYRNIETDLFEKFFHPTLNQEIVEIIKELKKKHRIVCGTNTIEIHYQIHLKNGDYCFFDHVYASHLLGIAKPESRFYQYIIDKERVGLDKAIFIDDTLENVIAARKMGIKSIHFVDTYSLKNILANYSYVSGHKII